MKLLLISNSTNAGEPYLKYPMPRIDEFLGSVREVVFVPYAGITFSYAEYEAKSAGPFCGIRHQGTFRTPFEKIPAYDPRGAGHLRSGGNTFALTKKMQEQGLLKAILGKIKAGTPYIAGRPQQRLLPDDLHHQRHAHRRTGIVPSYRGREVPDQPHYLDANPEGHAGETREQRILEYIEANPRRWVAGLREGCMLRYEEGKLELIGKRPMRMFRKGTETFEIEPGGDLSFLL